MPIISNFPGGSGGSGGGLALAAVSNIQTLTASRKVYVKWTDPEDMVVAEATLATWAGTVLVRKAGSTPTSRRDGTIVLDSKDRNKYQNEYFCDSGLTDGVTYYYKFFPYTTQNAYTDSPDDEFNKTPNAVLVGNVTSMSAEAAGNGKLALKWTDPNPTVVEDGVTLATWGKTVVVIKEGGYATDPDDSSAAFKRVVTTRNQYATNALIATGLTNGTTYYVTFFPVTTDEGINTNVANRITGVPNRLVISEGEPKQKNVPTYNGQAQNPQWDNYDPAKVTISAASQTNAGTYDATATPTNDWCWKAGDYAARTIQWIINRKTGTLTVSSQDITLDKDHKAVSFTIGGEHDGAVSISIDSGSDLFSAELSGNTVTVKALKEDSGSGKITVKCAQGTNYTAPGNVTVNVTVKSTTIYGVKWDGTSATTLTRTDGATGFVNPNPAIGVNGTGSSPFDNLTPWKGMEKVTDAQAGELVKIPKFWYKLTKSGNQLTIQIANGKADGFFVSPAHMDRGDGKGERDEVYIGRYHCVSGYKSATGARPLANITRSAARAGIKALGTGIYQMDFAMRFTIWLLYIVEFANWDSQSCIGYGCGNNSATQNMGYTDSMKYHTGTTAANRTTYGLGTQYRYIEGLWDNVYDWMDGCYYSSAGMSVILNPNNFDDSKNGTVIGTPSHGWIAALDVKETAGAQWFIASDTSGGSGTAYVPDCWDFGASNPCLCCGSGYYQSLGRGLFCVSYSAASNTNASIGCRLQKLP